MAAAALSIGLHAATIWPARPASHGLLADAGTRPMVARLIYAKPIQANSPMPEAKAMATREPENVAAKVTARPVDPARPTSPSRPAFVGESTRSPPAAIVAPVETVAPNPAPAVSTAKPGLPPAPDYAVAATLNPPPRPLHDIDPAYPPAAGARQGTVVLRLLINEAGHVDNVAVVRSTPAGVFDDSALAAFGTATFSPGMLLGLPVKSQWTVEVEFVPVNRGAAVSGRDY